MNINTAIITGNLTRDPELRQTVSGTSVLQFSVAVNDRVKENGEGTDRANYIDCTMFGTRAESLSKMLHKGSKVAVQGKLHWSSWEKNGEKRSKVEIWPDTVELLTPRNQGQQGQNFTQQKDMGTVQAEQDFGVTMEQLDGYSDIPF